MPLQLFEGVEYEDRKGRICTVEARTSTTVFSFVDPVSGRKFRRDGKSAVAPDFDLIREVGIVRSASAAGDPRKLTVGVWCGDFGLCLADVEVGEAVTIQRVWMDSNVDVSDAFLSRVAFERGGGFVSLREIIEVRAREEAFA